MDINEKILFNSNLFESNDRKIVCKKEGNYKIRIILNNTGNHNGDYSTMRVDLNGVALKTYYPYKYMSSYEIEQNLLVGDELAIVKESYLGNYTFLQLLIYPIK